MAEQSGLDGVLRRSLAVPRGRLYCPPRQLARMQAALEELIEVR
jgi:hypothetical protein